jgi:hypothetical protein
MKCSPGTSAPSVSLVRRDLLVMMSNWSVLTLELSSPVCIIDYTNKSAAARFPT